MLFRFRGIVRRQNPTRLDAAELYSDVAMCWAAADAGRHAAACSISSHRSAGLDAPQQKRPNLQELIARFTSSTVDAQQAIYAPASRLHRRLDRVFVHIQLREVAHCSGVRVLSTRQPTLCFRTDFWALCGGRCSFEFCDKTFGLHFYTGPPSTPHGFVLSIQAYERLVSISLSWGFLSKVMRGRP